MTRKDYILIAAAIAEARRQIPEGGAHATWEYVSNSTVARVLAHSLASDNPRFDRERFLKACGVLPVAAGIPVDTDKHRSDDTW